MDIDQVGTIKDKEGKLIAVVYYDMQKRCQVFYSVSEMSQEGIKSMMTEITKPE